MSATARVRLDSSAVSASWQVSMVVPAASKQAPSRDAFDAIRHECAVTATNLIVAGPEESYVALRPVTERGESFRGKHGKLTVIRKVR
jgi:hypothetical protein